VNQEKMLLLDKKNTENKDRWYHSNAFRPTDHVNHEISLDTIAKRDPNIKSTKKILIKINML
jgi:hypothetical protein